MLLSRSRRVPLAAVAMAFLVLVVDWACHGDRPLAPGPTSGPAALARASAAAKTDSVRMRYVCADRFRIRNHGDSAVSARWLVVGTSDSGTVLVPGRPAGAKYSEVFLDVPDAGTVRLFVGGVRVASARNRGRECDMKALAVQVDPGVVAVGVGGDTVYPVGSTVSYSFAAAPGYTHVLVLLDDSLVPATGSVTMGRGHVLWAAADVDVVLPSESDGWVVELRSLLTAPDPVARYQQILDDAGLLFDAVGPASASRRLRLAGLVAYDLIRDSAAIVRVDSALALHEFVLGGGEYGGTGGGVTIADRAPVGAVRDVAVGAPCTPQRQPEVPGTAEPTRIVYVNGIWTGFDAATRTDDLLKCAMIQNGQLQSSRYELTKFYNRTWSTQLADDIRGDVWCVASGMRWGGVWSTPSQIAAYALCKAHAVVLAVHTNDYVEAVREYASVLSSSSVVEEDADSLARYLANHRHEDGEHMIVVAHSQGNLLMQQALQLLKARGEYIPRRDSLCIGVVSIAAPTSSKWQLPADYLVGLQASGDLLSLITQHNHFPTIATRYSDSTAAEVARIKALIASARDRNERRTLAEILAVTQFTRGERLHSIDRTYLGEQPTRDAITGGVTYLHRQCTIGRLAIAPEYATIRVQSTLPIQVSAWNRNSTAMTLNRGVDWNVPSHLTLSANGRRVTATAPGSADLQAAVFDREAVATIEVPMESLSVSATQTFHSAWKHVGGGYPSIDGVEPPAWDGIPSTCTQTKTVVGIDPAAGTQAVGYFDQHCWYSATGTVVPPDGIKITSYWWRWYDVTGWMGDGSTNRLTTYSPQDMPADEPIAPFAGWVRLEVWGMNADGIPIAKGSTCIMHCGVTP